MPVKCWYPMGRNNETGFVGRETFEAHLREIIGRSAPGDDARGLCRTALEQWRLTKDPWWLAQIGRVDDKMNWIRVYGKTGKPSIDRYFQWRGPWFQDQILLLRRGAAPPEILCARSRSAAEHALYVARKEGGRALTDAQRALWAQREAHHRGRLISDAVARWEEGKTASDGRIRAGARRAYDRAVELGWDPPPIAGAVTEALASVVASRQTAREEP